MNCTFRRCGLILFVMFSVASCGRSSGDREITAAFVPAGFYAPLVVAEHEGFFDDEGYDLTLERYNNNSLMINAFLNNALDLTAQSAFTLFPIAAENDHPFQFVYGQYLGSYFFVVAEDSSINSLGDLRGATVGTWQSPTAVAYINILLAEGGLRPDQYEIRRFGAADVAGALSSGSVDAIFAFEFQTESLVQEGGYRYVAPEVGSELVQGAAPFNGGAVISKELVRQDPNKAAAISRALGRAVDFIRSHPDETREILADRLGVDLRNLHQVPLDEFARPNGPMIDRAESTAALMREYGLLVGDDFEVGLLFGDVDAEIE